MQDPTPKSVSILTQLTPVGRTGRLRFDLNESADAYSDFTIITPDDQYVEVWSRDGRILGQLSGLIIRALRELNRPILPTITPEHGLSIISTCPDVEAYAQFTFYENGPRPPAEEKVRMPIEWRKSISCLRHISFYTVAPPTRIIAYTTDSKKRIHKLIDRIRLTSDIHASSYILVEHNRRMLYEIAPGHPSDFAVVNLPDTNLGRGILIDLADSAGPFELHVWYTTHD